MAGKSMTDVAYDMLSSKKRPIQFAKIWEEVSKKTGASKDKVAQFYSDLTLDPRFTSLKENKWDLVERRKYAESHVDISQIQLDDEEVEIIDDAVNIPIKEEDKY